MHSRQLLKTSWKKLFRALHKKNSRANFWWKVSFHTIYLWILQSSWWYDIVVLSTDTSHFLQVFHEMHHFSVYPISQPLKYWGRICKCTARWTGAKGTGKAMMKNVPVEELLVFYSLICQDISCALWQRGLTDMGRVFWVWGKCHPLHFCLGRVLLQIFVHSYYLPQHFLHMDPRYCSYPLVTLCWWTCWF